jgi:cobalt-zinc-cadmium efflux system protein
VAGHTHGATSGKKFWLALIVSLTFTIIEAVSGQLSHSLALLSDAGHNFTDALALGLAAYAVWISKRPASAKNTYGYHRVAILTALFNASTLLVIAVLIGLQAYQRLLHPVHIGGFVMMAVAAGGLLMNTVIASALAEDAAHSLNARAAFIHMAGDAISSFAVIVAGVTVQWLGWTKADPIVSFMIAAIILVSGVGIVRDSIAILMESVPKGVDVDLLVKAIKSVSPICDVHDLHVWQVGDGMNFLSCHVTLPITCTLEDSTQIVAEVNNRLHDDFGIGHATIQAEPVGLCKIEADESVYCALTVHDHEHDHGHAHHQH